MKLIQHGFGRSLSVLKKLHLLCSQEQSVLNILFEGASLGCCEGTFGCLCVERNCSLYWGDSPWRDFMDLRSDMLLKLLNSSLLVVSRFMWMTSEGIHADLVLFTCLVMVDHIDLSACRIPESL